MQRERVSYEDCIFAAGVIADQILYFFGEKENALIEVDINTGKMKYSDRFNESNWAIERTDFLQEWNKKLYRIPYGGRFIEEFSLTNGKYEKIIIGEGYGRDWDIFADVEMKDGFLYLFPKWEKEMLYMNTKSHKVEKWRLFSDTETSQLAGDFSCFSNALRWGDTVWLFETENGWTAIFDLNKNEWTTRVIPGRMPDCVAVCREKHNFYFLSCEGQIYSWDLDTDQYALVWEGEKEFEMKYYFGEMFSVSQKLILLPGLGDDIVIFDCEGGNWKRYNNYPHDLVYKDAIAKYSHRFFEDDNYYYHPMWSSNYLIMIDKKTGSIRWKKMTMPLKRERMFFLQSQIEKHRLTLNDELDFMVDFLEYIQSEQEENDDLNRGIGRDIWEAV